MARPKKVADLTFNSGRVLVGDCLARLKDLPDASIDSVVTDPPYEIGFMGKDWDNSGIAYRVDLWRQVLRVLKPGGHLLAFGGTRTYHRMTVAIQDAGFEIRDSIHWIYGSGFPKSHNVSKAIDKEADAKRPVVGTRTVNGPEGTAEGYANGIASIAGHDISVRREVPITAPATDDAKTWEGWGTALKPAHEPIVLARKPLDGTVTANVKAHGTGALNIDGARIGYASEADKNAIAAGVDSIRERGGVVEGSWKNSSDLSGANPAHSAGRWPANVIFDPDAAADLDRQEPGASRFFYIAKPSKAERNAGLEESSTHPTVKPLTLMRYLVRLVTPPGGVVLDPFLGSGTTAVAAILEGFAWVGCEMTADYVPIIKGRVTHAEKQKQTEQQKLFNPA